MVKNPGNKVKSESIDEVILRLLGLKPGVEIDYQTYYDIIKKKLALGRLSGKELPREEDELLREEFKRVRSLKDKGIRFKVKKARVKKSKASPTNLNQKQLPVGGSAIAKYKKQAIIPKDLVPREVDEESKKDKKEKSNFSGIKKTLDSILKTLGSKFKFDQKQTDQDRKEKETEKRGKRESTLEGFKKGVAGIVATTKKMLDPFQAIIDRIWRFVFFTLLGRAFTKFMDWMSDKENQNKFNAFIEFLSDHWPALAGLYILFGTGFGKLVRGLLKGVTRMIVALAMSIPKIFGFIRKNKKLSFLALAAAPLVSREIGNLFTDKPSPEAGLIPTINPDLDQAKQSTDQATNTKVPKLNFGGMIPKFNLGGMLPSFSKGAINPFGGMDLSAGVPISGAGQDDTLIAAKTGEAILTEKDQADLGQRYVDRTTGQPLNIPQYLAGRKPGSVAMGNLRFPGFGGRFFGGGVIPKFNAGGVVSGKKSETNNGGWWQRLSRIGSGVLGAVSRPLQGIRGRGLGGTVRRGYHGTSPESARSIRQANRYRNWQAMGLGFKPGSWQNIYLSRNAFMTPERAVAERFATSASSPGRGIFERGFNRGVRGAGEIIDVAAPFGSGSFLRLPGASEQLVRPDTLTKGMRMMEKINSGQYSRSARARQLLTTGQTTSSLRGARRLGKLAGRFAPGANIALGAADTAYRLSQGDIAGSGLSLLSMIPGPLGWAALASQLGYDAFANPQRKQGGGLIERKATELVDREMPNTIRDYYEQLQDGFIQSTNPEDAKRSIEEQRKLKIKKLIRDYQLYQNAPQEKQGGGLIKENTGRNIPGATADRQLVAAQPGEFMIPVDTVNRYGISFFEKLVAMTDSNSNAYLQKGSINRPQITPYKTYGSSGMDGMITLPPITQSTGGSRARSAGLGGGSDVPEFSATAPGNERAINASIYGLVG